MVGSSGEYQAVDVPVYDDKDGIKVKMSWPRRSGSHGTEYRGVGGGCMMPIS